MNLLDAKVIQTKLEKEIFLDQVSNLEISHFQYPGKNQPYYEFFVGIIMGRIRSRKFYGVEKVYFGVTVSEDLQTMEIFDPEFESVFAARYGEEGESVAELIHYILIDSPHFKELIQKTLMGNETPEVKKQLLSKLLTLEPFDFKFQLDTELH